ncbi:MAG: chromate efflux transporter [Alphaproteobacteria bacterium]|nr:chromate efflux transporter [Alphaproteobacteria bacterium]
MSRGGETESGSVGEVFAAFLKLGLTAFGGPVAHIGYFRAEFVDRRRWLNDAAFADLVALCQFLPGPASSQVGLGLGARRAGPLGAAAAWAAFTLPSAVLMILAAWGVLAVGGDSPAASATLHGLKLVAVAVVAQAVRQMAVALAPDRVRASILAAAAALAILLPGVQGQLGAIACGAAAGLAFCRGTATTAPSGPVSLRVPVPLAVAMLALFAILLALPAVLAVPEGLRMVNAAYRAGSLVFGGGHVVLPLLEVETVRAGLIGADTFLAGYGMAQAVPGPLFTFVAFLGTAADTPPGGVLGGVLALLAIFVPAALLLFGVSPFWDKLRGWPAARSALTGINAAVVGLLVAALYDPVITAAIQGPADIPAALAAYVLLAVWKVPPWAVVLGFGTLGAMLGAVSL